jgi:hypothetical protein
MLLHCQFGATIFKATVQLVEMGFGLCDVAFESRDIFALDATILQIREGQVASVDQLPQ